MSQVATEIQPNEAFEILEIPKSQCDETDKIIDEKVSVEVEEKCNLKRKEIDVVTDEKVNNAETKKFKSSDEDERNAENAPEVDTVDENLPSPKSADDKSSETENNDDVESKEEDKESEIQETPETDDA